MDSILSGLFPIAIAVFGIIVCFVVGRGLFSKAGSDKLGNNDNR